MPSIRSAFFSAVAAVAVLSLAACGGDDDDGTGNTPASGDDADVTEVTVAASDLLAFEPATITVKAGQPVRVVLENEENTALHDFSVESMPVSDVMAGGDEHAHGETSDFAVHVAAEAGNNGEVMFTPEEPGEYEFFCSVPGHREAGMTGTIIVEA